MALRSFLFRGDAALEKAAVSNPDHILLGAAGPHVGKIQQALIILDDAGIDAAELELETYGQSTAAAVLAYKTARDIVARNRQTQADDIVGIMTMAALDKELLDRQEIIKPAITIEACGKTTLAPPADVSKVSRLLKRPQRRPPVR